MLALAAACLAGVLACDKNDDDKDSASAEESRKKKKPSKKRDEIRPSSSASAAPPAPSTPPVESLKFVRERPIDVRAGVDACAYLGGLGMACLDALIAEGQQLGVMTAGDPALLRLTAQAHAYGLARMVIDRLRPVQDIPQEELEALFEQSLDLLGSGLYRRPTGSAGAGRARVRAGRSRRPRASR